MHLPCILMLSYSLYIKTPPTTTTTTTTTATTTTTPFKIVSWSICHGCEGSCMLRISLGLGCMGMVCPAIMTALRASQSSASICQVCLASTRQCGYPWWFSLAIASLLRHVMTSWRSLRGLCDTCWREPTLLAGMTAAPGSRGRMTRDRKPQSRLPSTHAW